MVKMPEQRGSASAPDGVWLTVIEDEGCEIRTAGTLSQLTFAVKDNIDVRGVPTTAGTPALAGNVPADDAGVTSLLRAAGARPVAKANLHELSLGVTSNNAHTGPVRNPHDPQRVAGGSSGGSAVSAALRLVDFSLGTDTGGSVRLPASYCGVIGFRPSTGRYPDKGVLGLSHSRDTVGVISADMDTVVRVDEVLAAQEAPGAQPLARLRVGRPSWAWQDLDPRVAAAAQKAVDLLAQAGTEMVEIEDDELFEWSQRTANTLVTAEALPEIADYLRYAGPGSPTVADVERCAASPDVQAFFAHIRQQPVTAVEYEQALQDQLQIRSRVNELFAQSHIDVWVFPTVAMLPPKIVESYRAPHNGREVDVFATGIRNLELSSVVGAPSISLPIATDGGMPVGLTIEALPGMDGHLLGVAQTVVELFQTREANPHETHSEDGRT